MSYVSHPHPAGAHNPVEDHMRAQLANHGAAMAGALITSIPTLIVCILLGKHFIGVS
ncbi:hypothetical protein [Microbacterium sp. NIBRBAC000506063]|uniref:hypothetical protein n=1 Tax=Microbacterium sp. NIBRBAC000506063 TaxID=2734618 RepID=UPI002948B759|nr:hypothetical protein [Microbacterium sp. NIBRBAC000506063]